jgi:hypothetical protein
MARLIPPAPINRPFVHNAAQPARPRKERRSQRIAEPVEIIDRFEVNIGDFVGSDTDKIKAAVAAAAALDKPAVIKLEHATTYTLTETIAVPKNYILIDLNQAVITRSTDYGPTFTFGYDITDLNTYRYTHGRCGIINGRIEAADGTMTTGYHISFRRVWLPTVENLRIYQGHAGIELRSCVSSRLSVIDIDILDRPNTTAGRRGLWVGANSATDFPGADHFWSNFNIWGGEPWRPEYVGPSLDYGILIQGADGVWMEESHIAGTLFANYGISTNFGHFVGNVSFVGCMSDWCHGQGLGCSATFGAVSKVSWNGWISGGPSRFAAEKTVSIVKGASGTFDTLPDTYIGRVRQVTAAGVTYEEGPDFVMDDNKIDWSPAGLEPASGTTYDATYTFTPLRVTNSGQGVAITAIGATPETTWVTRWVDVSGPIEGHGKNGVFISSRKTQGIKLHGLNIATNVERGDIAGGILIERGSGITVDDYTIDGLENARYGLRVITNPVGGAEAIGVVDDVMIGNGRIKNCEWYGDSDINGIPGIGLQVTPATTNVVVDGCNARNNPVNLVARGSEFHDFPAVVRNSLDINPTRYKQDWAPGTIAASGQAILTIPASGVTYGDFIENIAFGMFIPNAVFSFAHVSVGNIVVRLENRSSSSASVASGNVTVDVRRNY